MRFAEDAPITDSNEKSGERVHHKRQADVEDAALQVEQTLAFADGVQVSYGTSYVKFTSSSHMLQLPTSEMPIESIARAIESASSLGAIVDSAGGDYLETAGRYHCLNILNAGCMLELAFRINGTTVCELRGNHHGHLKHPWYCSADTVNWDERIVALSPYAYLRSGAGGFQLESAFSACTLHILDPQLLFVLHSLGAPKQVRSLIEEFGEASVRLLYFLLEGLEVLRTPKPSDDASHLQFWQFHDLLFHTRSRLGRNSEPYGGVFRFRDVRPPLPAIKHVAARDRVQLEQPTSVPPAVAGLLDARTSTRALTELSLPKLSAFLFYCLRVKEEFSVKDLQFTKRPYPSGGASYDLEVYLLVNAVSSLECGLYHYDAGNHLLARLPVDEAVRRHMSGNYARMYLSDTPAPVVLLITSRFGRVAWKYSAMAYALVLKHVGVLFQTFYLVATDLGLGACALGGGNSDLFSAATSIDFYEEPLIGEFILGVPIADGHPEDTS